MILKINDTELLLELMHEMIIEKQLIFRELNNLFLLFKKKKNYF